jgi:hypothetical protein
MLFDRLVRASRSDLNFEKMAIEWPRSSAG